MTVATTSLKAYREDVEGNLGERQELVYNAIKLYSTKGSDVTNSELAQVLNVPINTITPRVFELRQKGLVRQAQQRKCNVTGRTAIAWEITGEHQKTLF